MLGGFGELTLKRGMPTLFVPSPAGQAIYQGAKPAVTVNRGAKALKRGWVMPERSAAEANKK